MSPITEGASSGLRHGCRRQFVIPSKEHLQLRCGNCGGMDFGAHVEPVSRGGAVARELVCRGCRRAYRLRPDLAFERTGTSTNLKGEKLP